MKKLFMVVNVVMAIWLAVIAGANAESVVAVENTENATTPPFQFQVDAQASILYESSEAVRDYIVALGKYKKRDNRWLPKKALRVQGQLTRYTLELAKHNNEADIFESYRQQLPQHAELLFSCSSRACGESNNWANDHFGVKQLYGSNASQHYAVFSLEAVSKKPVSEKSINEKTVSYITIYTVRRGNRRLYTQLDVLAVYPSEN